MVDDKEFMEQFEAGKHTVESISDNFGQKFYVLSGASTSGAIL